MLRDCLFRSKCWCATLLVLQLSLETSASIANAQEASGNDVAAVSRLDSLEKICGISNDEAIGQSVECWATVTYVDPVWNYLFLQDGQFSRFATGNLDAQVAAGSRIHLRGHLLPGDVSPVINLESIRSVGRVNLPEAVPVEFDQLEIGAYDARYVSVDCKILQILVGPRSSLVFAESGAKQFYANFAQWGVAQDPYEFIGKSVRLSGSLGLHVDAAPFRRAGENRPFVAGLKLFCDSPEAIEVLDNMPKRSLVAHTDLRNLFSAMPERKGFLTTGQVSLIEEYGSPPKFIAFDEHEAIRFNARSVYDVLPGEVLRIGGTAQIDASGNVEFNADFLQIVGHSMLGTPPTISIAEAVQSARTNHRIAVTAQQISAIKEDGNLFLVVSDGEDTIDVKIQYPPEKIVLEEFDSVRQAKILGVVSDPERTNSQSRFQISMPTLDGVEILERQVPPTRYIVGGALFTLAVLAASLLWIHVLRAQVAQKTKISAAIAAQLRSSYDSIDDGLLAVGPNNEILAVNSEACRIIGCGWATGDNALELGDRIANQLEAPEQFLDDWKAIQLDPTRECEFDLEFASPELSNVVIRTAPILSIEKKAPIGRLWVLRDETEKRKLQSELLHSNKLDAIGRLVSGVAHDFNNMLAAVTANLSVAMLNDQATVGSVRHELNVAEDAAFRCADAVRQLLTFSGKPKLSLKPTNINAIILELRDLVQHTFDANHKFEFCLTPENPVVMAESTAIKQVLLNLYVNARDALPTGGEIITSSEIVEQGLHGRKSVSIQVSDNGCGIPEAIRDKIFEPFFTTKSSSQGSGLGLSVSYRVVEQHGGTLTCESHVASGSGAKQGTRFEIILPVAEATVTDEPKVRAPNHKGHGKILVVDDEAAIRSVAEKVLRLQGYATSAASNGAEALDYIEQNAATLDGVLLDLTMPGIPGREVLHTIKKKWPKLPVVLCSGYLVGGHSSDQGSYAPDAEIPKPYSMSQLISTIESVLSNPHNR